MNFVKIYTSLLMKICNKLKKIESLWFMPENIQNCRWEFVINRGIYEYILLREKYIGRKVAKAAR